MEIISALPEPFSLTEFERAVTELDELETIPAVTQQLLAETSKTECRATEVFRLVSSDPTISARVMRAASSPMFGARAPTNLQTALLRLGTDETRRLAVTAGLISAAPQTRFHHNLWEYSLKCAAVTDAIGARCAHNIEDPFLCGLLHDFGCMILARLRGNTYKKWVTEYGNTENQVQSETDNFGVAHTDLGAMLAASWNLFEALEYVMQLHHSPLLAIELELPEHIQGAVLAVALARIAVLDDSHHDDDENETTESGQTVAKELCTRLQITQEEVSEAVTAGLARYDQVYASLLAGR